LTDSANTNPASRVTWSSSSPKSPVSNSSNSAMNLSGVIFRPLNGILL